MLHRLVLLLKKPRQRTPKHFEYDQIKTKIFGFKRRGYKATGKRKGKNHKLPSFTRSLKFKDTFFCEITQNFPSFQPIFNFRQEC